ncbi:MAG: hypothetical protein FWF81_13015 [Defluviitaleaceae bacterium]|nr:hypothetical protein [Defluviitaleaceae bacterium]
MYKKIENSPRMTRNQVSEEYPDKYILMQRDNRDTFDPTGVALYVGDNYDELFSLQVDLPVRLGVVIEGINISSRLTLGDLVVNG